MRPKKLKLITLTLTGFIVVCGIALNLANPTPALAANSNTINFQARLLSTAGAIVPDGTYNLEFKLYSSSSSSGSSQGSCTGDSSCLWVEDYTGSNRVNVTDGYISANLGSITAFPTTINWNQPLYLTMNVGGVNTTASWDGEMTPRMQLTAIPYAFMANSLANQTGSYQSTLGWATQGASNTLTLPNLTGTLCVDGESDGCSFGANYIQNTTTVQSSSNFNISGNGTAATSFTAPMLQSSSGNLTIQAASGTVTLGTSTNLTAGGALTITSGGTNTNLSLNNNGTGNIYIGSNGSGNNTIQIGNSSGTYAQTINIGTNTTGNSTIAIGSTTATLTLQSSGITQTVSGSSDIVKSTSNFTTAFQVQNASNLNLLGVDTSGNNVYLGSTGTEALASQIYIGNSSAATQAITIGSSSTSSTVTLQGGATSAVINNSGLGITNSGSTTALNVSNGTNSVFSVNTSASQVILGTSTNLAGSMLFNTTSGNPITIQAAANSTTGGYKLTLPTSAPVAGLCLEAANNYTTSNGALTFSSCSNSSTNISEVSEVDTHGTTAAVTSETATLANVGDLIVVTVNTGSTSTTGPSISSIASSGTGAVTNWSRVGYLNGNGTVDRVEMWEGTVSAVGSTTITVTPSATLGNTDEIAVSEYTASGINAGSTWGVDVTGTNVSSGSATVTYPSLTPQVSGELYVGYAQVQRTPATAGSTTGFAYVVTGQTNLLTYNTSASAGVAYQPTGTQASSGSASTIGAVFTADIASTAINNSTVTQQANFNVQAGYSGSVTGVLQAASSGSGDILDLLNGSGTKVFTVGSTGNTLIEPANSSTAFQVQNASNLNLLGIDTSGNNVYLGSTGTEALASQIYIGTSSAATQAITIGSSSTSSTVTLQGGATSAVINNSGLIETATSATALTVQSSSSAIILNVDTTTADAASAVTISSGASGVSGLKLSSLTASNGCTGYCLLLGVNSSGQVGASNAAVSLTSPTLAYWDGLNDPTVANKSYPSNPQATVSGTNEAGYPSFQGSTNGEELNPASTSTSGSINWNFSQVPFEEVQFQFKASGGTGADATWFYSYANSVPTSEFGCNVTLASCTSSTTMANGYIIYFSEYHDCIGIAYGSFTDGNQCVGGAGVAGDPLAAVTMPAGAINDSNWHNVDIQFFQNKIYIRWDGNLILQYSDVYTRDLTDYGNFGFGARSGSSTDAHYIKGLLVTKLSNATQYNVDSSTPLASDLYWTNTNFNGTGAGELGVGTSLPRATLEVDGSSMLQTLAEQGSTSITACISSTSGSCGTTAGTYLTGTGTSFSSAMVGDTIVFPDGTTDTIASVSSTTSATVSTSVLQAGSYFTINSGGLQVNNSTTATTENVTIGANTTFGGSMYTNYVTNGNATATISNAAYGYDLSDTDSGIIAYTEIFNITGLPSTEGTTAYIVSTATRSGIANDTVKVEINGTVESTVVTTAVGSAYNDFVVMYADGMWRILGGVAVPNSYGTATLSGADYAEWIDYSGNTAPQAGDVVSVGSDADSVADSAKPYDSSLVGVVSTSPYEVGGTDDGHSVVLALAGRVPVKVSLENGPIEPGDPLTSSSIPGVAMKATGAGEIIGTALEAYDGTQTSDEITVQLHTGYDNPNSQNGTIQGDQTVVGNLSVGGNTTISGDTTVQGNMMVSGGINAGGTSSITTLLVGNTLTDSGNLEVDGTAVVNSLQSQTGNVSGNFNVGGNTTLAALLVGGNLSVNGNITTSGSVTAANLSVSGTTTTQNLTVTGTATLASDLQLTGKVNTRQATIKTFTASGPIAADSAVVLDNTQGNAGQVTTTTTPNDPRVIGVAVTTASAAGDSVQVAISGWVQVNVNTTQVNGSSPALIEPGELIATSSTPGTVQASPNPTAGSILGKATDNQDSNNQVWIIITLQ